MSVLAGIEEMRAEIERLRAERDATQKRFEAIAEMSALRGCELSEMQDRLAKAESMFLRLVNRIRIRPDASDPEMEEFAAEGRRLAAQPKEESRG